MGLRMRRGEGGLGRSEEGEQYTMAIRTGSSSKEGSQAEVERLRHEVLSTKSDLAQARQGELAAQLQLQSYALRSEWQVREIGERLSEQIGRCMEEILKLKANIGVEQARCQESAALVRNENRTRVEKAIVKQGSSKGRLHGSSEKMLLWFRSFISYTHEDLQTFLHSYPCQYGMCKLKKMEGQNVWDHEHRCSELAIVNWTPTGAGVKARTEVTAWPGLVIRTDHEEMSAVPLDVLMSHPVLGDHREENTIGFLFQLVREGGKQAITRSLIESAVKRIRKPWKVNEKDINRMWDRLHSYVLISWNVRNRENYPYGAYSWIARGDIRGRFECHEREYGSACHEYNSYKCTGYCKAGNRHAGRRVKGGYAREDFLAAHMYVNEATIFAKKS